jgi:hypothetical protein
LFVKGVTAPWLQSNAERNLDAFFDYLNSRTPEPKLSIDMTPLKRSLPADAPADAPTDLKEFPSVLTFDSYNQYLRNEAKRAKDNPKFDKKRLADVNNLIASSEQDKTDRNWDFAAVKRWYSVARIIEMTVLGLTLFMLSMISLTARRSQTAMCRWIGWTLAISGAVALPAGIACVKALHTFRFLPVISGDTPQETKLITSIQRSFSAMLFSDVRSLWLFVVILGVLLVVISVRMGDPDVPATPDAVETHTIIPT